MSLLVILINLITLTYATDLNSILDTDINRSTDVVAFKLKNNYDFTKFCSYQDKEEEISTAKNCLKVKGGYLVEPCGSSKLCFTKKIEKIEVECGIKPGKPELATDLYEMKLYFDIKNKKYMLLNAKKSMHKRNMAGGELCSSALNNNISTYWTFILKLEDRIELAKFAKTDKEYKENKKICSERFEYFGSEVEDGKLFDKKTGTFVDPRKHYQNCN